MKYFFYTLIFLFATHHAFANGFPVVGKNIFQFNQIQIDTSKIDSIKIQFGGDTAHLKISKKKKENTKLIAAILAFPVPFGFMGLHRIYLGTAPWIPVVYIATLGGGMLLPLMDFIAIVCANEEELKEMENNPRIFMWVN